MKWFRTATMLACMLACGMMRAQGPGQFGFRNYATQDGLGNLVSLSMCQDPKGFLWVGTEDGLYRFDGQEFKMFGTAEGLPSSFATETTEDASGRLWVGTFAGLAVQDGNRFRAILPQDGLPALPIQDLAAMEDGRMLVAMPNGPYLSQEPGSLRFAPIAAWPGGQATAACGGPSGHLWAASFQSGEAKVFTLISGTWKRMEGDEGFGSERIDALAKDRNGVLWARDAHHLWELRPSATRFVQHLPAPATITARASLHCESDGSLFVPTDQGLWILNHGQWTILDQRSGLPSNGVLSGLKDREGSVWVGGKGVSRLLGRGLWRGYTEAQGLPSSVIRTIFRSRKGTLYVGTDQGLAEAEPDGWRTIPATAGKVIRTAVEAPDGTFYLGSMPTRVLHWNPATGKVDAVYGGESGLHGKRLFRLLLDGSGVLWASTEDAGLLRADTKAARLRFEPVTLPGGTLTEFMNGLVPGPPGQILASGSNGLAVLDHGTWRRYTKADGLDSSSTAFVYAMRNGEVLLGYFEANGISRLRADANGVLRVLPPSLLEKTLAGEKIYMFGEDSKGRAWIGTGRGVFVSDGSSVQHFGLRDGLISEDVDNMAFLADPGGDVWVGTGGGLARFDAQAFQGAPQPPATVLLSCAFGSVPVGLTGEPEIPHARNTMEARFAGMSFLGERTLKYQVRLEGLESDWHLSDTPETRYPALPPGQYTLQVRSRIGDGAWGQAASFTFTILPAWWQSWWFRALIGLALAGAILAAIRWRVAALRRHNRELAALVHQRTAELEEANEALQAQSLTDSLTGLKNRRYLGVCMPEDVAQVRRVHRELNSNRRDRFHTNVDLALIMVDLDHFKEVNDTHGHAAGDLVLKQVAEILQDATRDTDTVVRWGGEEFLIIARNAARKDAVVLVERIRSKVEAHAFDLGDGTVLRKTCSIGFALMPFLCAEPEFMSWEEVVDVADHCLYVSKRSGRNGWVGVLPGMEVTSAELGRHVASHLPNLAATPLIEVLCSYPDPAALDWWQ